jgi:hypothetical protein
MTSNMIKCRDPKLGPGSTLTEEERGAFAGVDGSPNPQKLPELNKRDDEKVIGGNYGSYIILGSDRLNNDEIKKYGKGRGQQGCFASAHIDLIAGLDSASQYLNRVPTLPKNPTSDRDAARVYISQNCDVDDQFQCPLGTIGNVRARSAVVAKADQVRIIGRNGIKIISGADEINSKGRKLRSVAPIDLIAGSEFGMYGANPDDVVLPSGFPMMQPIPRGFHLQEALLEILKLIQSVNGALDFFYQHQQEYNNVIMSHTHPDYVAQALSLFVSSFGGGRPSEKLYFLGQTGFAKTLPAGAKLGALGIKIKKNFLDLAAVNKLLQMEFLAPNARKSILSRHIRIN